MSKRKASKKKTIKRPIQFTLDIHTNIRKPSHIVPIRPRRADRKLAHKLALAQVLDLGVDEVTQALEVQAAFRARTHKQVAPDAGRSDRVINSELHRSVQAHHLLHEVVWARVYRIWPCDTDSEPPSERLRSDRVRELVINKLG
jgi:hypothetical protein